MAMRPRLRLLPLILATAAFSECGAVPVDVILETSSLPTLLPVAGSDSVDCTVTLVARLGGTGKGREVRWEQMTLGATDPADGSLIQTVELDAAQAAERLGGERLGRDERRQVELAVRLPRPANVGVMVLFQALPAEGLVHAGRGLAHTEFACTALPVTDRGDTHASNPRK